MKLRIRILVFFATSFVAQNTLSALENAPLSLQGASHFAGMLSSSSVDPALSARMHEFDAMLTDFIGEFYNRHDYASIISQDSSHLLILLRAVKRAGFGKAAVTYTTTIMKLFHEKMKAAELVDDTVITRLLSELPTFLEPYFAQHERETELLTHELSSHILNSVTSHLHSLAPQSHNVLDVLAKNVAHDVAGMCARQAKEQEEVMRLRHLVIRLLENILGKATFSYSDYESFLPSLRTIAHGITRLVDTGVIDHADDLDSLMWSLVHRACYFLELAGSSFPLDFYDDMSSELEAGEILFLEEEELDAHITSKKEVFSQAIAKARFNAVAYHKAGIISQPMV